ncbi:MAG: Ribosomal RNA small subunit methyltransferase H [Candidatus Gottesmanbacteria bacterium GW2011_GWA1_34_13]|uniref:Ribosomal RNA small subunit methyltransferase H n=1 Tax=Candidatus Gottesmanbacteria bacterium GW2011_GWA1_34_13 TaxID=1618434 RepID=A0A0G0AQC7_9BACT|nr:MAG: Ribosomal RNA small subunit methyltransferase H [Candidatus Gottesmanbacteria bacterium GW2011_GWA1_34_13]
MKTETNQIFHEPVLLNEVVECLQVSDDKWYIDATAGGGGHTKGILNKGGKVLCIDRDLEAVAYLKEKFKQEIATGKVIIRQMNFNQIKDCVSQAGIAKIYGIIFDLGLSTYQIKKSTRGFSFNNDAMLDMRMSQEEKLTAKEIINNYSQNDLYEIFRKFGEENLAREIAYAIYRARSVKPIEKTGQLKQIVESIYKKAKVHTKINPATKVFQALRIEVNRELENLQIGINQAMDILIPGGRCAVISFHSLEDRIVKQFFNETVENKTGKIIYKRPLRASKLELRENPSSRSAKLRIIEKL